MLLNAFFWLLKSTVNRGVSPGSIINEQIEFTRYLRIANNKDYVHVRLVIIRWCQSIIFLSGTPYHILCGLLRGTWCRKLAVGDVFFSSLLSVFREPLHGIYTNCFRLVSSFCAGEYTFSLFVSLLHFLPPLKAIKAIRCRANTVPT